MTSVINPDIRVKVETIFDEIWDSAEEPVRLDIEVEITKDLSGDTNQAVVRVYNLNSDTVNLLSSTSPNIEVFFNQYGDTALVSCFLGEIVNSYTAEEHPGSVTNLICESQRAHSRDRYVKLNYESGTAFSLIVEELIQAIDLPVQKCAIPDRSILSSITLTGPAFLNLKEFLSTTGLFCYIVDGILYVSSIFEPPVNTVVEITKAIMLEQPQPTTRRDVRDLWYTLSMNNSDAAAAASGFEINRGKVKKVSRRKLLDKNKTLVQVDAVDTDITGRSVTILGLPNLQPDTVIQMEGDTNYYRIQRIMHRGDNRHGLETQINADMFEGN